MKIAPYLIFVSFLFIQCETPAKYNMAILNGQVINLETGDITVQDIYIKDGRIALLMTNNQDFNFESPEIIDAEGKFVLPGFWDNHVHFRGGSELIEDNKEFLDLFIANGITTVRDAGGDLTPSVLQWRKEISEGKLIGPKIFTSGPKIDGPKPTWAGSLEVDTKDDIEVVLDSLETLKVDFVKLYDSKIYGDLYLETIRAAEKRGLKTSGHMPFTVQLNETLDAGLDAVEHLYYVLKGCSSEEEEITEKIKSGELSFWPSMELLINSYDETTAEAAFQKLKDKNTFVVPTLHIGEVLSYLDEVDHSQDKYLSLMSEAMINTYRGRIRRAQSASAKAIADRKSLDSLFVRLAKRLQDNGIKLMAGSDSGAFNSYTYPGVSLHRELEAMVNAGFSELEALQTSAYNGAQFFEALDDYGTISEGKIADIILLGKNPLEDIKNTTQIKKVIQNGKALELPTLNFP